MAMAVRAKTRATNQSVTRSSLAFESYSMVSYHLRKWINSRRASVDGLDDQATSSYLTRLRVSAR